MPLTIMTFNIHGSMFGEHLDGINIWENRAELNLRIIRQCAPDIIGFQEYQTGNQQFYDTHLPEYAYETGLVTIDNSEFGMWNPIYWRSDRFAKLEAGGFYLSKTPDVFSTDWDAVLARSANWVRLLDKHTNRIWVVCNVHLDHLGEESRVESAKLVVKQLAHVTEPLIVLGDFNSRAWAPPDEDQTNSPPFVNPLDLYPAGTVHQVFTGAGYVDTFHAAGHMDAPHINTFHEWRGKDYPPIALRIDWILGKRIQATNCTIVTDAEPPVYPSDHYPVVAVVDEV
ncbi:MAG: hypothetical protein CUN56_11210 [Phototrophicales bacterium]|nr:MAG: hypothetical protein CUN56_11210 [Phototrophicales bacterium]RMG75128.1 MAG: endonuclease/exonuclease/phosphatase family protein [Chloroflexota bacterium]